MLRPLVLIAISAGLATFTPWRAEAPSAPRSAYAERGGLECAPPRPSRRTFVGFAEDLTWNGEVEPAAVAAKRIFSAVRTQTCQPQAAQGAHDAAFERALRSGVVEITAVSFERDDLGRADVRLQLRGAQAAWSMPVHRGPDGAFEIDSVRKR